MSGILTVRGRQVNGQDAVIAEAFEVAVLPFLLGELAVHPNTRVCVTCHSYIRQCGWVVTQFCWCRGGGRLPVLTRGCGLLTLAFPVASVALQGVSLELLEHLGVIQ